jgi:hypothetical protein
MLNRLIVGFLFVVAAACGDDGSVPRDAGSDTGPDCSPLDFQLDDSAGSIEDYERLREDSEDAGTVSCRRTGSAD